MTPAQERALVKLIEAEAELCALEVFVRAAGEGRSAGLPVDVYYVPSDAVLNAVNVAASAIRRAREEALRLWVPRNV